MTITAIYHVKDEEEFLYRSLLSVVPFVDETIIFDTASTDKTPEICKAFALTDSVRYYRFEQDFETRPGGEREFRNEAISLAKSDWILQIDGDCVLSNDWRKNVDYHINNPKLGMGMFKFYEHVGSYEWTFKGVYKNRIETLFRKHDGLRHMGGNEKGTHGSIAHTAHGLPFYPDATWFHYGYTKRDIVSKFLRGVERGDHGQEEAVKSSLAMSVNAETVWDLIGWKAERHPYSMSEVPWSMRDIYERTYKLQVGADDKIIKRHRRG